jgi:hypothetical protein
MSKRREGEEQYKLRRFWDYINPLLNLAMQETVQRSIAMRIRGKLLVRVNRQWIAEQIAQMVTGRYGLSADWIGCNLRDDETNQLVIKRFLMEHDEVNGNGCETQKLDALIQVGMAGEGFNCQRIIAVLDLTAPRSKFGIQTKQFILRGSRWITGVPKALQVCRIYVPADHFLSTVNSPHNWLDDFAAVESDDDDDRKNDDGSVDVTTCDPNGQLDELGGDFEDPYGPYEAQPIIIEEDEYLNVAYALWEKHGRGDVPTGFLEMAKAAIYQIRFKEREEFSRRDQEENAKSLTWVFINKCVARARREEGWPNVGENYQEHVKQARRQFNQLAGDGIEAQYRQAKEDRDNYLHHGVRPSWLRFLTRRVVRP